MARAFALNPDGTVSALLEPNERELLVLLIEDILEIVQEERANTSTPVDVFDQIVADFSTHRVNRPHDPAEHRLFPDAFAGNPEAAAEFRRFTEQQLRTQRALRSQALLSTLAASTSEFRLSQDQAHECVQVLTDLRLVLGTRLGISDERDEDDSSAAHDVYDWLTWLQEGLVQTLFMLPPQA
jgi:hypothetical protein